MSFDSDRLIDLLYEAAAVPELWPATLATLADTVGARGTALITARGADFISAVPQSFEMMRVLSSSAEMAAFAEEYSRLYPQNTRAARMGTKGQFEFVQDCDLSPTGQIILDQSYNDYMIPRGYGTAAASVMNAPSGDTLVLHAEFRYTGAPLAPPIINLLNTLRPHLARSALVSARVGFARMRGYADAMEAIGIPGAVLRGRGKVYIVNKLFQELMPALFQDRAERLTVLASDADVLFAEALATIHLDRSRSVKSIPIAATAEHVPMVLHLVPMRGAANDIFSQATALLIVTPVDRAVVPTSEVLQGLFDLTPAEARVAYGISLAQSVETLATANNVSLETVRTQLKAVLAKVGLRRQQELVSLLAGKAFNI